MGIGHSQNNNADKFVKIIDFGVSLRNKQNPFSSGLTEGEKKLYEVASGNVEMKELVDLIKSMAGGTTDTLNQLEGVIRALNVYSPEKETVTTALDKLYPPNSYTDDVVFDWTPKTKFTYLASALAIELLKKQEAGSGFGMGRDYTASYKRVTLSPGQKSPNVIQEAIKAELKIMIEFESKRMRDGRQPIFPIKISPMLIVSKKCIFAELQTVNGDNILGDLMSSHVRGFGVGVNVLNDQLMLVIYYYTPDLDLYTHCWYSTGEQTAARQSLGEMYQTQNHGLKSSLNLVAQEIGRKLLENHARFGYGASKDFVVRYIRLDQADAEALQILSKSTEDVPNSCQAGIQKALEALSTPKEDSTPHENPKVLFGVEGDTFSEFSTGVLPSTKRKGLSQEIGIAVATDAARNAILVAVHFHPDTAKKFLEKV